MVHIAEIGVPVRPGRLRHSVHPRPSERGTCDPPRRGDPNASIFEFDVPEQGGTRSEMLRDMSNPCGKVTFCRSDVVGSTGARSVGRPLMVANDDGGR